MDDERAAPPGPATIAVRGAHEHNLKHVDVDIPRGALTVITGVSGSGKSSLAFDTIGAEGRRRYLETFSSYARQYLGRLSRPAVAHIDGLSPAITVDQSTIVRNPRSTVGTMTELYDLLRLLWARVGTVPSGNSAPRLERQLFSFNSPHGACPTCKGLGVEDRLDPTLLVADATKTVRDGALRITTPTGYLIYSQVTIDVLDQVCRAHGFTVDVPWNALTAEQRDVILNGSDRIRIPYGKHPLASRLRWTGITARPREEGLYKGILPVMEQTLRQKRNTNILRFVQSMPCRACRGTRLRPEALAVTFRGLSIADVAARSIDGVRDFFDDETDLSGAAKPLFLAVRQPAVDRCALLQHLGLGHLALDRESTSLSGGEAQRIRLARQAGVGLSGLTYVLDEPSIGLHHRDMHRLLDVLHTIRDRGNTMLVVEHDEDTIRQADWIVDVGPGAGSAGGEVLFSGPASAFTGDPGRDGTSRLSDSRTHAFLTGREQFPILRTRSAGVGTLTVSGITKHNLRGVDVSFLLGAVNVITGVSGAGKSTLLAETRRLLHGEGPGPGVAHVSVRIDTIIEIDQAPIGRTPRSNPATYTGLFDHVRDLFAAVPEARRLGFGKGRFSFNVAGGRCEACEGAGIQQFAMQFLGSVAIVCDACNGRRFSDATLAILYRDHSIHDVLDMSVADARVFFSDCAGIERPLAAMDTLGLGYLPLGHPATQLSGGEAQRVKLATELAKPAARHTLYLLDEPTIGLHAADVALLLKAMAGLVERGHTVIVIEHDLHVIAQADHVVDLGPESGDRGGRVVAIGPPEAVAAAEASATGEALRAHHCAKSRPRSARTSVADADTTRPTQASERAPVRERFASIRFTGVSTHNLQHIDVEIPHNQLTVITGVSGSGKSSLAFDTVFAEGQQRFAESFSTYARRFVQRADEADFEDVAGLTATIAIRQQAPSKNPRSTVGTLTEIHDVYRLLFSRAGRRFCPHCHAEFVGRACAGCGFIGAHTLTASMFSPNSEVGACPACHGLGHVLACDPAKLVTDPSTPLAGGALSGHKTGRFYGDPHGQHMAILAAAGRALRLDVAAPWSALSDEARSLALQGAGDRVFDVEWQYQRGTRRGVHTFRTPWVGLLALVLDEYTRKHADARGAAIEPLMMPVPCHACGGGRLTPEALAVRFGGYSIPRLLARTVGESLAFFADVDTRRTNVEDRICLATRDVRDDIVRRLVRLRDAGLAYLALDRPASTLSGGEAQRVRLATQLQSGLTGVTYVLDEPTAGLHPRDTDRLVGLLRGLRDAGNTIVVVEHDLDVIAAADHVIDVGPGAGHLGGRIIAQGTPDVLAQCGASVIGPHLRATRTVAGVSARRPLTPGVTIEGASAHNLAAFDIDIPAGGLIAVTGVSGSGKSSLVFDVLGSSIVRAVAQVSRHRSLSPYSRAGHPGWQRRPSPEDGLWPGHAEALAEADCSSLEYSQYSRSSRLATRAPRSGTSATNLCYGTLGRGEGAASPVHCRRIVMHTGFRGVLNAAVASSSSSPWSMTATLTGVFDALQVLFASTPAATAHGLRKADFSTAGGRGRCDACSGLGRTRVSMDFLPDVWLTCDACGGTRYGLDVRACTIEGRSIADVLELTVDEAQVFLGSRSPDETVRRRRPEASPSRPTSAVSSLAVLQDIGLGYIRLGQPVRTLSGGERQRLALATSLLATGTAPTLYLFDEPTTGLHPDDVNRLMHVFDRLIAAGHTIVVVEHNLDVIARADWVIDLGPEGGNDGGRLVAAGPPDVIAACAESYTGRALRARI